MGFIDFYVVMREIVDGGWLGMYWNVFSGNVIFFDGCGDFLVFIDNNYFRGFYFWSWGFSRYSFFFMWGLGVWDLEMFFFKEVFIVMEEFEVEKEEERGEYEFME